MSIGAKVVMPEPGSPPVESRHQKMLSYQEHSAAIDDLLPVHPQAP